MQIQNLLGGVVYRSFVLIYIFFFSLSLVSVLYLCMEQCNDLGSNVDIRSVRGRKKCQTKLELNKLLHMYKSKEEVLKLAAFSSQTNYNPFFSLCIYIYQLVCLLLDQFFCFKQKHMSFAHMQTCIRNGRSGYYHNGSMRNDMVDVIGIGCLGVRRWEVFLILFTCTC